MSVAAVDASQVKVNPKLARLRRRFTYRNKPDESKIIGYVDPERAREIQSIVSDTTMRSFVAIWDSKIAKTAEGLGMGDRVDDIKQDVYTFICRKNPKTGLTGLQSYDPARASLSAYVYWVINAMALNLRAKLGRDRLQLVAGPKDDPLAGRRSKDSGDRAEFWLQIERISADLDAQTITDADSFFVRQSDDDALLPEGVPEPDPKRPKLRYWVPGRLVSRDARTVLELLANGVPRKELSKALRCSAEQAEDLVTELQQNEGLLALLTRQEDAE